uniref:Secreted protein n=1 Tax=Vespula pensylvanica TaxID=30213 RepID=A0A834P778_VESPE|nr:hypothetical protein H0235_004399 [Vespula pensylvanica]
MMVVVVVVVVMVMVVVGSDEIAGISVGRNLSHNDDNTWTPPDQLITTLSTSASSIGHRCPVTTSWKKTRS